MRNSIARIAVLAGASLVLAAYLAPRSLSAEPNWIIRNNEKHGKWSITPSATLMPMYFSPGLRFAIPVAPKGFIPTVNDEVKVELGCNFQIWWHPAWGDRYCYWCDPDHFDDAKCDACRRGDYVGDLFFRIGFPVMLRWEFYFTRVWSLYAGLGFEFGVPFEKYYRHFFGPDDWFWIVFQVGNRFRIRDWFAIRLEIGTIGLLVVGFEFMFGGKK